MMAEATASVGRLTAENQSLRGYLKLVPRVREEANRLLPPGARVAVVGKGDDALLALDGKAGRHFPPGEGGGYAGYHPADSAEAIRHLESLRREGVQFLLFPAMVLSRRLLGSRGATLERRPPRLLSRALARVNEVEVRLLGRRQLPFGSSLVAWAERTE